MKTGLIKTTNLKRFVSLMSTLENLPSNIPKLALVYGEHGLGKTQTILWWATNNDAVYVRATRGMTPRWLLSDIADELGEAKLYFTMDLFSSITTNLIKNPKIIIIDEVDYLVNKGDSIEILRDLHDKTKVPIVLVGMGGVDKKISRFKHLEDRIYQKLCFEKFTAKDIKDIIFELTDLNFTDDALAFIASKSNQFRQIIKMVNRLEKIANTNNISEIDEITLKEMLNDRKSVKTVQTSQHIYA